MHLAIDIGNTQLKFALFDDDKMSGKDTGIEALSTYLSRSAPSISSAIIASVADSVRVLDLLRKFNIRYSLLSHRTPLPIQNLYLTPDTLGSDRIALAVATDKLFEGAPALV